MKIMKLGFITLLVSIFFISFLLGCSGPMSSLNRISTLDTSKGAINALAFSPDGKRLAVASSEGLRIYDTQIQEFSGDLTTQGGGVRTLAWSDQGLASGSDSTIDLWNVNTKERYHTFDAGAEALVFIDNTWIFCVTYKYEKIDRWDIRTGNRLPNYPKSIPRPRETSLSMGGDSGLKNIEPGAHVKLGKSLPEYKHITRRDVPSAAALAPNGMSALALKDVVSNNDEGTEGNVRVRVTPTGKKKTYYIAEKMKTPVTTMALSTDGNFLATASRTATEIQLWNVKTGKLLRSLTTQTNGITALAFSRDGTLASGSRDGTISLWGTSD